MTSNEEYISKARKLYQRDGAVEIDSDAHVSASDDGGAYVQAWVWVADGESLDDIDA